MKKWILSAVVVLQVSQGFAGTMQDAASLMLEMANGARVSFNQVAKDSVAVLKKLSREDAGLFKNWAYIGKNSKNEDVFITGIPVSRVITENSGMYAPILEPASINIRVSHQLTDNEIQRNATKSVSEKMKAQFRENVEYAYDDLIIPGASGPEKAQSYTDRITKTIDNRPVIIKEFHLYASDVDLSVVERLLTKMIN